MKENKLWKEVYGKYSECISEFNKKLKEIDEKFGTFAEIEIENKSFETYWKHHQVREIDLIKICLIDKIN